MWMVLGVATPLVAGCAASPSDELEVTKIEEPLVLTAATNVVDEGRMEFNTTAFVQNPTTLLEAGDFHGYNFRGKAGAAITITMTGAGCAAPDTFLHLFKPAVNGDRGQDIARNDDAGGDACSFDSKIAALTLPVDGDYLIVATSYLQEGGGHYALTLTCDAGDAVNCAQAGQITFATSRLAQTDIDAGMFTPAQLFSNGFFLFKKIFRIEEGLGNALIGAPAGNNPQPNFRNVHQGAFGAPEAQSCATCHNLGGVDGAGDNNHNIFQIGDGVNPASGVPRHPPVVLGLGFRQQVGIEMTNELKAQRDAALAAAAAQNQPVTAQLSAKGISFGSLVANPSGTVDSAGVRGVDPDLVVRPFGWKGREASLRRFIEGGFRVHFGMQTAPSIAKHCAAPNPNTFGTGPDCQDPDGDGVKDEITEGQLTSIAIYLGLRQVPIRVPPADPKNQARAVAGEQLFTSVGCATCHVPSLKLVSPTHNEPADTTGGGGVNANLATDTREPRPGLNADNSMTIEAWTDYKRHDMGPELADSKPFNQIAANQFITTPLWGVGTSPPYLHDGRAPTLHDAIIAHGGEAGAVRNAYAALSPADQQKIVAFLSTLLRQENVPPPAPQIVPSNGLDLDQLGAVSAVITITGGVATFNTDTGAITGVITRAAGVGARDGIVFELASSPSPIGVFTIHQLIVTGTGAIRFTGSRAAAFIVEKATIDGIIDGSAGCYGSDRGCAGPGGGTGGKIAAATGCGPGGAGASAGDGSDAGGGGGGGGRAGARGGASGTKAAGGGGVACIATTVEPLLGGGGGGTGGRGVVDSAQGGGGGGAVQISAVELITVGGTINMGGAGATGGRGDPAGNNAGAGAGGGAGGAILLEAPAITITGVLAANGGGGGGGGRFSSTGGGGGLGAASATPAAGGIGAGSPPHDGGTGGAGATAPATGGAAPAGANAAGGGGGVGAIFIRTAGSPAIQGGIISPAHGTGPIRTR